MALTYLWYFLQQPLTKVKQVFLLVELEQDFVEGINPRQPVRVHAVVRFSVTSEF